MLLTEAFKFEKRVVDLFFGYFLVKFADTITAYFCEVLRNSEESNDCFQISEKDILVVHHAVGYACHYILKRVRQYNNDKWKNFGRCIKTCFLEIDEGEESVEKVRFVAWTESLDRGSLKYLTPKAMDLFMHIFGVIGREINQRKFERSRLMSELFEDDVVMYLWFDLVGHIVGEEDSAELDCVCEKFLNTCGRGEANRRRSEHVGEKSTMPFRATVASK